MVPSKKPEQWNEFEWEQALRDSDEYAARYFKLLRRFCDLPGSDTLIAAHLENPSDGRFPDCNFNCESCPHRWECEFAAVQDWDPGFDDLGDYEAEDANGDAGENDEDAADIQPGDPLFYEITPVFINLRQVSIGWCNVYAAVLPQESRVAGLKVLFHLGRALAYVAYSVGDGLYEHPAESTAFAKRSLDQINQAVGRIQALQKEKPRLRKLLDAVLSQLLEVRGAAWDLLLFCREQNAS